MNFSVKIAELRKWLHKLEDRKRALFILVSFLLILLVWVFVLYMPLMRYTQDKIESTRTMSEILEKLHRDNVHFKLNHAERTARVKRVMEQLSHQKKVNRKVVFDSELRDLLTSSVTDWPGIQFIELKIQSPELLKVESARSSVPPAGGSLFNFPVAIHFQGGWQETYGYLLMLANMPWNILWKSFNYEVKNYPVADVMVNFYITGTKANLK